MDVTSVDVVEVLLAKFRDQAEGKTDHAQAFFPGDSIIYAKPEEITEMMTWEGFLGHAPKPSIIRTDPGVGVQSVSWCFSYTLE